MFTLNHGTPSNPFAWPTNFSKSFPEQYDELGLFSTGIRTAYNICSTLGLLLTLLLIFLVTTKSKGKLKSYSRMLLLCTASDLLFWLISTLCQPVSIKHKLSSH